MSLAVSTLAAPHWEIAMLTAEFADRFVFVTTTCLCALAALLLPLAG